jgi:hypothetical protein
MKPVINFFRSLSPRVLMTFACLGCANHKPLAICEANGSWHLQMTADSSSLRIAGSVAVRDTVGSVDLTGVSVEGTGEPMQYPLRLSHTSHDSIAFKFAPIGYSLRGICRKDGSWSGTFAVPQPPFDSIRGHWTMQRDVK